MALNACQDDDDPAAAWEALERDPESGAAKRRLVRILKRRPALLDPTHCGAFLQLLRDPDVEPTSLARAGWALATAEGLLAPDAGLPAMAERIEDSALALALLEESYVPWLEAELALGRLRRWLLVADRWHSFPRTAAALIAQAALNCGAWPFDDEERERLRAGAGDFAAAYLPPRADLAPGASFDDQVTGLVADQYRAWPYPVWTRITKPAPTTVPATLEAIDPGGTPALPADAELLLAGCGTGREAAILAARYPEARITAIDISEASLAFAADRVPGVDFRLLDLHRVAELGRSFDLIVTSGVLHHLPDPEKGWQALVSVLKPGGAIKVMLYSRLGRLRVRAARTRIADLLDRPVDDELLREARRRLIEQAPALLSAWHDFYTLPGIHDLLLHRHEDPFDVPRIRRAIADLRLELLGFVLPDEERRGRYLRDNPDDPLLRDYAAWESLEKSEPFLFSRMYEFWCRKPLRP
jgi:SAM-dependent methyltransferase